MLFMKKGPKYIPTDNNTIDMLLSFEQVSLFRSFINSLFQN